MRLTAGFWVQAYVARLAQANIPAFITAHGDDTAGAVIVKSNTLDGRATAFQRGMNMEGGRSWHILEAGVEADVDLALARQRGYDPDLWIIEVEDRDGRTLLEEEGLSE